MVNLSDFNIIKKDAVIITVDGKEIRVRAELSNDEFLLMISDIVSHCYDFGKFVPYMTDVATGFYIVYYYTDIVFTEAEVADITTTMDKLAGSGILSAVLKILKDNGTLELINETVVAHIAEKKAQTASIAAVLSTFLSTLEPLVSPIVDEIKSGNITLENLPDKLVEITGRFNEESTEE